MELPNRVRGPGRPKKVDRENEIKQLVVELAELKDGCPTVSPSTLLRRLADRGIQLSRSSLARYRALAGFRWRKNQ
jgi:transposase